MFLAILEAARPKQWIKNLLIFVPLVFAEQFLNPDLLVRVVATFGIFCLASSGIYILNDVFDRKSDRTHPEKKSRPIASGRLSIEVAILSAAILFLASVVAAWQVDCRVLDILLGFIFLQIGYSLFLKHLVIVDILAIAFGFILRIFAGGAAVAVAISNWLLAITFLLALLLATGKRLREIETAGKKSRRVLENYPPEFLRSTIKILLPAILVSYLFYSFQGGESTRLFWTAPIVIFGLLRYLFLFEQKTAHENPTDLLFEDRPLLASVILWMLAVFGILYFA